MGIGNMKIVYLERNSIGLDISVDCFRQFGDVTEYPYAADAAGTAERIADADIVLVNKAPMNAETLGGAAHVKLICEMATGYDNIDIDYCRSRGSADAPREYPVLRRVCAERSLRGPEKLHDFYGSGQ